MQFSMMEGVIMDKTSHGGVVNLLRMAKTQCGSAIAFAAIRKGDGHFAIATFPTLGPDSPWGIEAVDELVRQAWADPHLAGGKVLVRSGRVVSGSWPGEGGAIKLAVAPLSDLGSFDRPWGLLCVADPMAGQFAQEHLDLLGTMAVRLTSYLRARQEVLEEGFAATATQRPRSGPAVEGSLPWPLDEGRGPEGGATEADYTKDSFEELLARKSGVIDEIFNGGAFESAFSPGSGQEGGAVHERTGFLGLEEPAWEAAPGFDEGPLLDELRSEASGERIGRVARDLGEEQARPPASGQPVPAPAGSPSEDLGSLLRPDPVTGLVGLPSLLGHLGSVLGALRSSGGSVGVVLIEVAAPDGRVPDEVLASVSTRLREQVRGDDMVARVGRATFAVVATLRTGPVDAPLIERRLAEAVRSLLASAPGQLTARSALATGTPEATTGPEDLLRHVAAQLALA